MKANMVLSWNAMITNSSLSFTELVSAIVITNSSLSFTELVGVIVITNSSLSFTELVSAIVITNSSLSFTELVSAIVITNSSLSFTELVSAIVITNSNRMNDRRLQKVSFGLHFPGIMFAQKSHESTQKKSLKSYPGVPCKRIGLPINREGSCSQWNQKKRTDQRTFKNFNKWKQ
ncbi:MAG: hypothetical protein PHD25_05445 [Bacteroidales bacterium]|nr:hypothetical protein [Bacteroidales bacterium]